MPDPKPIPISRSSSPYRDLAYFEEPLISFSVTPGASPPEGDTSHRNEIPRYEQLHPQAAASRSQQNSMKKTDYEIALELAREDSLMDMDNPGAQHYLYQEQLLVAAGRSTSHPIRSNHPRTGAERRSITDTSQSNPDRSHPHNVQRKRSPISLNRSRDEGSGRVAKAFCPGCQREARSFCNVCNITLCDDCWDNQIPHRLGTRGPDNVPHEKTDREVAQKIQAVLDPNITHEQRKNLHQEDENTTWFGVAKDELDELIFQDCGKYASLMADCFSGRKRRQYPGLVSFVGQTGAGKSTLIKMLIDLSSHARQEAVPVVGSVNHSVPTSGDVHLYVDPCTHFTDYPILYADCEGLEGGEQEPMALQARRTENNNRHAQPSKRTASFQKRLRKKHHSSQRLITWATTVETKSRQFVVKNLYPRLLYTFSDVVVFVLRNPRVIENAVEQLIMWASAAVEKSTNQPVLPHLIIALNATENSIDEEQWDVEVATRYLMQSITDVIFTNSRFMDYVQKGRERNQVIQNAVDLLRSYYSTVRVVRIPTKGRPQLISDQLGKLYQEIVKDCMESRKSKRGVGMLLDSDELQPYLQHAFDHFSKHLETPFDFVKASFLNNPIPRDFGGNILKTAISVMHAMENMLDGVGIFKELSPLVASCIMLDSARHKTKGTAESIFREHYIFHCDDAIEDFCERHWPCEYKSNAGRCVNVRSGHSDKGHQLESGRTFGFGPYVSSFSAEYLSDRWKNMIHHDLELLLQRFHEASSDNEYQEQTAANIHKRAILDPFYRHVGFSERHVSHSTCLACLIASPQHALPCGHVLCTPCLQAFGLRKRDMVEVDTCPLLHKEQLLWTKPWQVAFKPASAGVRVLTLDGGGIRGIVELEILRLIQKALGAKIPIQDFFDLIVGTSTGGIIALGLGVEAWPVDECIARFTSLCEQAFIHRKGYRIPGLAQMVVAHNGSIYETRPLQKALMTAFTDNYLFGGPRDDEIPQTKVAVTAASAAGLQPVVLSNYSRLSGHEEQGSYLFQRPEEPEHEFKIWEAARATSAAPTYYKQFSHEPSGQVYIDGGIWHNNPVVIADSERKIMWPDVAHLPPDMLLSIGSGCCSSLKGPRRPLRTARKTGIGSNVKAFYRIAVDHIESSLDSEKAWREYLALVSPEEDQRWRYRRLNVELDKAPPKLDDLESLSDLREDTRRRWAFDGEIRSIAQRLVASSFFFEKTKLETLEDESLKCSGMIHCRFLRESQQIRELGAYLQRCQVGNHSPYFVVQERYSEYFAHQIPIPKDKIKNMTQYGIFTMQLEFTTSGHLFPTDVLLCLDDGEAWYSISGFPRLLQEEEGPTVMRKAGSMSNRRRTPSRLHRRGIWAGPKWPNLRDRDGDTISNYSNPNYVIGNPTPAALDTPAAHFEQSIVELEAPRGRFELDASFGLDASDLDRHYQHYQISDTSREISEEPIRMWPDHLTQPIELDGREIGDRDVTDQDTAF